MCQAGATVVWSDFGFMLGPNDFGACNACPVGACLLFVPQGGCRLLVRGASRAHENEREWQSTRDIDKDERQQRA